jgi:hypothetical protein
MGPQSSVRLRLLEPSFVAAVSTWISIGPVSLLTGKEQGKMQISRSKQAVSAVSGGSPFEKVAQFQQVTPAKYPFPCSSP